MLYSEDLFQLHAIHGPMTNIYYEDLIFHPLMDIKKDDAFTRINMCKRHFYFLETTGMKTTLHPLLIEIDSKTINELYTAADNIVNGGQSERFLTGLQIYFGRDNGTLIPIFEPVKMGWKEFNGNTMDDLYTVYREDKYWKYDATITPGSKLVAVSDADFKNLRDNYKHSFWIKHNEDGSTLHAPFDSLKKDTESLIIPFQAIFKLTGSDKNLFIHNSVRKQLENPLTTIKHSILISTSAITLPGSSGAFSNRSHLCPPCDSNVVGFDLAT